MSAPQALFYVISGNEYSGWKVTTHDTERQARSTAEAWAKQGHACRVLREVARCTSAVETTNVEG